MDFKKFKEHFVKNAKEANACQSEFKRVLETETIEELIEVIKDNFLFVSDNNLVTKEMKEGYEKKELLDNGKDNEGLFNSGDLNSGDRNSGNRNSGYRNSGNLNSGNLNSGYRNSGDRNSGYRNSGNLNSGNRNSGYRNSGDRNSGYRNSGDLNSGYRNSGDLNSGYRNSGVFCNKKREDTVVLFNKESMMTWDNWYSHRAYYLSTKLEVTAWVSWSNMTDEEKKNNPKAYVCEGYVREISYKEAWAILWANFSEEEKNVFKTLPNFDSEIFEDITGIIF